MVFMVIYDFTHQHGAYFHLDYRAEMFSSQNRIFAAVYRKYLFLICNGLYCVKFTRNENPFTHTSVIQIAISMEIIGGQAQNNTYTTTERRCDTHYDEKEKVVGYQVEYRIGDRTGSVRMDRHPGERIPLQDGELVLAAQ